MCPSLASRSSAQELVDADGPAGASAGCSEVPVQTSWMSSPLLNSFLFGVTSLSGLGGRSLSVSTNCVPEAATRIPPLPLGQLALGVADEVQFMGIELGGRTLIPCKVTLGPKFLNTLQVLDPEKGIPDTFWIIPEFEVKYTAVPSLSKSRLFN